MPPYTRVFPEGIAHYTDASLDVEVARYEQLASRLDANLSADDALRATALPGVVEDLDCYRDAAAALVLLLSRMFLTHGARPALLWTERTDTFAPGVVTTATSAALFPDRLQAAAETCHLARIAHVGPGGEAEAARSLFDDLATATHAILDGRMLGVVNATLGVFVVGDGMGVDPPLVRALRDSCDVEVNEPSVAVAEAILRALARRA